MKKTLLTLAVISLLAVSCTDDNLLELQVDEIEDAQSTGDGDDDDVTNPGACSANCG